MKNEQDLLAHYSDEFNKLYKKRKIILSFEEFTKLVADNPRPFMRDASHYLTDVFTHYGEETVKHLDLLDTKRYKLFDLFSENERKIIGCEKVQNEIYHSLSNFKRKGFVDKLIFLYGPSGSSKSLTIDKIMSGMENYSVEKEGAVYKFNWIFPISLDSSQNQNGRAQMIGFNEGTPTKESKTFAFLTEGKILSKIQSEFKENPLFLIPMPYREDFLREVLSKREGVSKEEVMVPSHLLSNGLSKRNQEILDSMLSIYNGNLLKVLRHIQVERFFYSSQYRVGISSIDPQVSVDAYDKQITINGNYHKLPPYLHDINFHESSGELVDANRGFVEYSDILSRPLGQVKQLLNTIERRYIKLSSSIAQLDLVYMATTDDKHMEAFKQSPEFNSFRGHFEPVEVTFLLRPSLERKIYEDDITSLKKEMIIGPHTLELLVLWAVMTRLKPCPLESFEAKHHDLLKKLGPFEKIKLYEGETLSDSFTHEEEKELYSLRARIWQSSKEGPLPEGLFGPSPREVLELLHKAAQNTSKKVLTPIDLFREIEEFSKQSSSFEYLKYKPQGDYFNQKAFLSILKEEYTKIFEDEMAQAMSLSGKSEYANYLERYIKNVVAYLKGEKIFNPQSKSFESPSRALMNHVEDILKINIRIEDYRSALLNKIAAYKIENPGLPINVSQLFHIELSKIKNHFFVEQRKLLQLNYSSILKTQGIKSESILRENERKEVERTFKTMEEEYGYSKESIFSSIKFITIRRGEGAKDLLV